MILWMDRMPFFSTRSLVILVISCSEVFAVEWGYDCFGEGVAAVEASV